MKKNLTPYIQPWLSKLDWTLIIFLILVTNVKLYIKLLALVFIFIMRPRFKGLFQPLRLQLPLFYLLIIIFSILQLLVFPSHVNSNYLPVFSTAIVFWFISYLILFQLKIAVEINETGKMHQTLTAFFMLNVLVSVGTLLIIMIESGSMNPYRFQGFHQKYFIGTGDMIRGISFDSSTTNAVMNAFGVLYFLFRKKTALTALSLLGLLLTGSNIIYILMALTLLFVFIFYRNRIMKSLVIICLAIMICFTAKIFPNNYKYMVNYVYHLFYGRKSIANPEKKTENIFAKPDPKLLLAQQYLDSIATVNKSKQKLSVAGNEENFFLPDEIKKPDIHSPSYQRLWDTTESRKLLMQEITLLYKDTFLLGLLPEFEPGPGKLVSYHQTMNLLKSDWRYLVFGSGAGNFSSKLAFRASGVTTFAGGFPEKFIYRDSLFTANHLKTYLYYNSKDKERHTILNQPNSVYNQLAGEYGLIGLFLFLIFYLGYFISNHKKLSYGIPLLIFMIAVFAFDYWFEQLSIVILFELLMLFDMHSTKALLKKENS